MPAEDDRLEVYPAGDGYRWRRIEANNRTLCVGDGVSVHEDHAWQAAYRACPDLDPGWTLQPAPSAVSLDAIHRLLNPTDDADRDAARTELLGQLP